MFLTMMERFILNSVLPTEGAFTEIRIIQNLREELPPTEEEHKILEFTSADGMTRWKNKLEPSEGYSITIGERATDIITEALKKLNDEKKLTTDHLSLYEKFVEGK